MRFSYSLSFRHCACARFLFVLKSACRIRQALCLVFKAKLSFFLFLFYFSFHAKILTRALSSGPVLLRSLTNPHKSSCLSIGAKQNDKLSKAWVISCELRHCYSSADLKIAIFAARESTRQRQAHRSSIPQTFNYILLWFGNDEDANQTKYMALIYEKVHLLCFREKSATHAISFSHEWLLQETDYY